MPELVDFTVSAIEYTDPKGNRLDVSKYQYQPYPKMLYRADGATKIVKSEAEHKHAGPGWTDKPVKKPIWDTRKPEPGFVIGEHHLAFLQANGFEMNTLEEAKAFFNGMPDDAKEAFLVDAAAWAPEPKRRGRPRNDEKAEE